MLLSPFDEIGSLPGKYCITCDPIILLVQHSKHRVSLEAKEEIETTEGHGSTS